MFGPQPLIHDTTCRSGFFVSASGREPGRQDAAADRIVNPHDDLFILSSSGFRSSVGRLCAVALCLASSIGRLARRFWRQCVQTAPSHCACNGLQLSAQSR